MVSSPFADLRSPFRMIESRVLNQSVEIATTMLVSRAARWNAIPTDLHLRR